ncbi:MAG: hypothetical protein H7X92_11520 [Chitinophagales bacterium]|nr:hypothetical protein [Hyphomicrobiales bacterium]
MSNIDLAAWIGTDGNALQSIAAIWGAALSTILAASHLLKRHASSCILLPYRDPEAGHTITLANLAHEPLLVSYWTFEWEPNLFNWRAKRINATPHRGGCEFTVKSKDRLTLEFSEEDKFPWTRKAAEGRQRLQSRRQPFERGLWGARHCIWYEIGMCASLFI